MTLRPTVERSRRIASRSGGAASASADEKLFDGDFAGRDNGADSPDLGRTNH
jgi:hypothetical protein